MRLRTFAFLALALLPACNSGKPTVALPKVAFVTNNPDAYWTNVEDGCKKAADEVGVELVFKRPQGGAANQKQVMDSLINQDVKAISLSVEDPKNQTEYLNEVAAKLPLLAIDNDAPASNRVCYIGTNNYAAGRSVGALVKEALPTGGTVALFVGQTQALNARQRCLGVLDELADAPQPADINDLPAVPGEGQFGKYKLLKVYTDQPAGKTKATENAKDALLAVKDDPNVCFVGLWAYNPPAIITALDQGSKLGKVKVVGFDEDPETLDAIDKGHIFATVVQDPFNFGYESVKLMASLAKGEKYAGEKVRAVPHRILTKDGGAGKLTLDQYRTEEKVKRGKTSR